MNLQLETYPAFLQNYGANALQSPFLRVLHTAREAPDSDYVERARLSLSNGDSLIQSEAEVVALLKFLPGIAWLRQSVGVDREVGGSRKLGALLYTCQ